MRFFLLGIVVGALLGVAGAVVFLEPGSASFGDGSLPAAPTERVAGADVRSPEPAEAVGAESAAEATGDSAAEENAQVAAEEVEDLAAFLREKLVAKASHESASGWRKALPLLRDRRAEVVPVLEDWIRRQEEIHRAGGGLKAVFLAYAELLGADAVPLLSERLYAPPGFWGYPHEALRGIDDPSAMDALRRYEESLPPGVGALNAWDTFRRTEAGKDLVRDWAANPPPGNPGMRVQCRRAIFALGEEAEQEAVWRDAPLAERLRLLDWRAWKRWPDSWPGRVRETILAALESEDRKVRDLAIGKVAELPALFEDEIRDRVLASIEKEMANLASDEDESRRKILRQAGWRVQAPRRERERAEKLGEALRPR